MHRINVYYIIWDTTSIKMLFWKSQKITLLHNNCYENHIKPENLHRQSEVLCLSIVEWVNLTWLHRSVSTQTGLGTSGHVKILIIPSAKSVSSTLIWALVPTEAETEKLISRSPFVLVGHRGLVLLWGQSIPEVHTGEMLHYYLLQQQTMTDFNWKGCLRGGFAACNFV